LNIFIGDASVEIIASGQRGAPFFLSLTERATAIRLAHGSTEIHLAVTARKAPEREETTRCGKAFAARQRKALNALIYGAF
jgi:hypothetical protein